MYFKQLSIAWVKSLYLLTSSIVVYSLLLRVNYRGPYYPGWELIGATKGYFLLSTRSLVDAFVEIYWSTRHFQYWNTGNSIFLSLIPGSLNFLRPWEFWAHSLSFFIVIFSLTWLLKFAGANLKTACLIVLGYFSSPALVSFSIGGYQYVSGILPYCFALSLIFSSKLHKSLPLNFLLTALILESSWHFYEVGKIVFAIFAMAAFLRQGIPLHTRVSWLLLSGIHLGHLASFAQDNIRFFASPGRSEHLWAHSFGEQSWNQLWQGNIVAPFGLLAALLAFFWIPRDRWFWRVFWLLQASMAVWVIYKGDFILGREGSLCLTL